MQNSKLVCFSINNLIDLNFSKKFWKFIAFLKFISFPDKFNSFNLVNLFWKLFSSNKFNKASVKLFFVRFNFFKLNKAKLFFNNKINRYYENERFKKYKTNFTNEDTEIQKIIDNDHYLSKKTNLTINIFDINNFKYVSKIKKFYPEILDRIDIETRFFDK